MLPLYEAKMFHQFDHRWATYDGIDVRDTTVAEKQDASFVVQPRYWVAEKHVDDRLTGDWDVPWLLAFRNVARATDVRTTIASALPRTGVGHSAPIVRTQFPTFMLGLWGSLAFDYVVRQKVAGINMTFTYVEQLPAIPNDSIHDAAPWDTEISLLQWVEDRARRLIASSEEIVDAMDVELTPWVVESRNQLRTELDAAFFYLFGVDDTEVAYMLDAFPILRRKEEAEFGHFRTKDRVLAVLAELRTAAESGVPFVSPLPELSKGRA